jgi:hypothetical protein
LAKNVAWPRARPTQEALVAELETEGHDAKDALAILDTCRETQTQHVLNVERLLKLQQQPE